jgi:hypothetical protein
VDRAAAQGQPIPQALLDKLSHWFSVAAEAHTGASTLPESTSQQLVAADPRRIALAIAIPAGATVYIGFSDAVTVPPGPSSGFLCPSLLVFGPECPLSIYAISAAPVTSSITWLALLRGPI